jgi:hypothetical protein
MAAEPTWVDGTVVTAAIAATSLAWRVWWLIRHVVGLEWLGLASNSGSSSGGTVRLTFVSINVGHAESES